MQTLLPDPQTAAERLGLLPRGDGRVRLEREGLVATLSLDHARRRNAMSVGMMLDLRECLLALESDPVSALVLHGVGGEAFCAGGDLRAVRNHLLDHAAAAAMVSVMTDALDRIAALPTIVLAAVDGPALGGGAEILTACHHVTASADSRIGFVQARLGVSPGWGGGSRLVARIGSRRAALVLGEARTLTAEEALEVGIIDAVVTAGSALETVRARARAIGANPPVAVAAAVEVSREPSTESRRFLDLWGGEAHRGALGIPE